MSQELKELSKKGEVRPLDAQFGTRSSRHPAVRTSRTTGTPAAPPAFTNRRHCFFHKESQQGRAYLNANRARRSRFVPDFSPIHDARSIQGAIHQVIGLMLTRRIEHNGAARLLHDLQKASSKLGPNVDHPPEQPTFDGALLIEGMHDLAGLLK